MKEVLKKIYTWLPFKKQLFLVLRLLPLPEAVFKHLHFQGLFSVRIRKHSFKMYHFGYQLENELFWKGIKGGWEKTSMHIWMELSRQSEYIIDIGANTGVFALASKAVNPNARVIAFEPVQRVFEKLIRNIEVNQFEIVAVCKGLSNFEGTAIIYDLPTEHVYSVTINENTNPPDRKVIPTAVDVTTLDAYCRKTNLPRIDLLKIDVETHEPAVLEGALETIRKCKPAMIIEILNEDVANRVNEILREFDYVYFAINENSGPELQTEIRAHQAGNYLVCKKSDAEFLKLIE